MELLKVVLILLSSYLLGSIVTGDIVAKFKKIDLRNQGSGNVGATNTFRVLGSFYGAIVLIGDVLKGVIAVLLGNAVLGTSNIDFGIVTGMLSIIGHMWPIFAKFKGGKGISTTLGVAIALTPWSLAIAFPAWLLVFIAFGYVSFASIVAAISYPISVYLFYADEPYKFVFAILFAILAIYRHKSNVKRLLAGDENRILYQNRRGAKDK